MTKPPRPGGTGEGPRRILITRLSAVGDCIHSMPLACALRDAYPTAYIAWVSERGAAPLLATLAEVNRVIVVPKNLLRSPQALWKVRQELRAEQFDLSVDPQSLMKSSALGWLAGAKRRIGFAPPVGREIAPWLNSTRVRSRCVHMVDRYLELLRPLGIEQPQVRFGLRVPADAEAVAEKLCELPQLRTGFAVLNPGAGWDSRLWPIQRFAEVARELGRSGVPSVVTWGGNRERGWAETIVAASSGAAVLAPPTSLLELTAVLRRARLVVASDTGPLHLAAAIGTPTVGLFGTTRREATGPYGAGHVLLQATYDGSPGRKLPGADNWAMRQISVAMVLEACRGVLGGEVDRTSQCSPAPSPRGQERAA